MSYDLLTEPWIPVLDAGADLRAEPDQPVRQRLVGLREAVARAHEIREVYGDSPLETVALSRLVLALALDALVAGPDGGMPGRGAWLALWERGQFSADALDAYLDGVRQEHGSRFDLLHPERPFYQHPEPLARDATTLSQLFHAEASGNNGTLFGHEMDDPPRPDGQPARRLGLAEAARAVLAAQSYGLGGLAGSAKKGGRLPGFLHAPLVSGAVFWLRGHSLFDALLLNAAPDKDVWMTRGGVEDRPAWRRELPSPRPRALNGLRDLLTRQARRITLVTEPALDGETVATALFLSNGESIMSDGVPDPMMGRVQSKKEGVFPFGLRSERSVWRDADLLSQVSAPDHLGAPETFRGLGLVALTDYTGRAPGLKALAWTADVFGIVNDKSKMLRWRHGRMPVYAALLGDEDRIGALRDALDLVNEQATGKQGLRRAAKTAAAYLDSPPPPGSDEYPKADPKAVTALATSLGVEPRFWSRVEPHFFTFLDVLARADDADARERALNVWADDVWAAADGALHDALSALDRSARHLRARAHALQVLAPDARVLRQPDDGDVPPPPPAAAVPPPSPQLSLL